MQQNILSNERGFTLIEIISVLVILGILASVAIPKYMDMQTTAKTNATQAALGAGASEVSIKFANMILTSGGTTPSMESVAAAASGTLGDFTYTYASTDTAGVTVTVTGPTDKTAGTVTKNVVLR